MGFLDILKKAGTVAAAFIPGAAPVLAAVNAFLPEGEKLPDTATGQQLVDAYEKLPADAQVRIKEVAASVEIAHEKGGTERYVAMCAADGQSTRPEIAKMLAQTLCFEILAFTVWAFVYPEEMKNPILWTVFATLTGVPAGILGKYFGELRKEQGQRLGVEKSSFLGNILNKIK